MTKGRVGRVNKGVIGGRRVRVYDGLVRSGRMWGWVGMNGR